MGGSFGVPVGPTLCSLCLPKSSHQRLAHPSPERVCRWEAPRCPSSPAPWGPPQLCLLRGLFLVLCGSSSALDRDGNWGPSHTLSFHPCELSDVERLTHCGKRREGGGTQMAREMGRRTDRQAYLWAGTHGPHASGRVHSLHRSSHVGVPCVREQVS